VSGSGLNDVTTRPGSSGSPPSGSPRAAPFAENAAALANTEENFGYVFDKDFEGLVLDRHAANAGLINRVFKDTETTEFFTAMARKIVYELAREAGRVG